MTTSRGASTTRTSQHYPSSAKGKGRYSKYNDYYNSWYPVYSESFSKGYSKGHYRGYSKGSKNEEDIPKRKNTPSDYIDRNSKSIDKYSDDYDRQKSSYSKGARRYTEDSHYSSKGKGKSSKGKYRFSDTSHDPIDPLIDDKFSRAFKRPSSKTDTLPSVRQTKEEETTTTTTSHNLLETIAKREWSDEKIASFNAPISFDHESSEDESGDVFAYALSVSLRKKEESSRDKMTNQMTSNNNNSVSTRHNRLKQATSSGYHRGEEDDDDNHSIDHNFLPTGYSNDLQGNGVRYYTDLEYDKSIPGGYKSKRVFLLTRDQFRDTLSKLHQLRDSKDSIQIMSSVTSRSQHSAEETVSSSTPPDNERGRNHDASARESIGADVNIQSDNGFYDNMHNQQMSQGYWDGVPPPFQIPPPFMPTNGFNPAYGTPSPLYPPTNDPFMSPQGYTNPWGPVMDSPMYPQSAGFPSDGYVYPPPNGLSPFPYYSYNPEVDNQMLFEGPPGFPMQPPPISTPTSAISGEGMPPPVSPQSLQGGDQDGVYYSAGCSYSSTGGLAPACPTGQY